MVRLEPRDQGPSPDQVIGDLAERCGVSRYAVGRWMSGRTRPRLPEWLRLVDAMTGRVAELVALLVPIERVPALTEQHRRLQASRRLAFDAPWTEAVLRLLETERYRSLPEHRDGEIARILGLSIDEERACLAHLVQAGVVRRDGGRYVAGEPLSVDTRAEPGALFHLKEHWLDVARERMRAPRQDDWFGYNVFSISRADLQRIRELHVQYFRAVRAIVAASEPAEVVGLINVHLMDFDDDG